MIILKTENIYPPFPWAEVFLSVIEGGGMARADDAVPEQEFLEPKRLEQRVTAGGGRGPVR